MDVYNQEKTNGTNILLFGFNGQTNQRFTVVHKGNGIYRLRPKHASGYTMDVTGSNVDIWLFSSGLWWISLKWAMVMAFMGTSRMFFL